MRTRAAIAWDRNVPWSVEEIELDPPKSTEALVRLAACGLCHSDDHILTGDLPFRLPIIGGHEGAGIVEEVGSQVTAVKPGDHVVMSLPICGRCPSCSTGHTELCDLNEHLAQGFQGDLTSRHHARGQDLGINCGMGAFAEHTVIGENALVKIDDDIPLDRAALVGCSVVTGWGSAVYVGQVRAGDSVAVVGVGGIGASAIQGARLAGAAEIFAIDPIAFKQAEAKKFGASHVAPSAAEALELIRDVTRGRMCNQVILTIGVGDGSLFSQFSTLAGKLGKIVVTNVHPAQEVTVTMSLQDLTFMQKQVLGSCFGMGSARSDIPKMLSLYKRGLLDLDGMITRTYSLDEVNQGYRDMHAGKNVRGVVIFG